MNLFNQRIFSASLVCSSGVLLLLLSSNSFALQGASFKNYDTNPVAASKPVVKRSKPMMRKSRPVMKPSDGIVRSGAGKVVTGLSPKGGVSLVKKLGPAVGRISFFTTSSTAEVYDQRRAVANENNIDHSAINIARKEDGGKRVLSDSERAATQAKSKAKMPVTPSASTKMLGFKFNNYDSVVKRVKPKVVRKKMRMKTKPVVEAPKSVMKGFKFRKF